MRIIIEIDNPSNQPSVQMQDSKDTSMTNTTVSAVNAIDAGGASNETGLNENLSESSNSLFNSMNSGGTSAGAAPAL